MTSLHVIYGLALAPNPKSWRRLCIKSCAIGIPHTGCCILALLMHLHERLLTTLQSSKIYVALLPVLKFFGMECNMEENFSIESGMEDF